MTKFQKKNSRRKGSTSMSVELSAIIPFLFKELQDWWRSKRNQPRLKLDCVPSPGSQGASWAGEIHFFVQNFGRKAATNVLIELHISKPKDIYQGQGLFFNDKIGVIEQAPVMEFLVAGNNIKPPVYRFRLNPNIYVNPTPDIPLRIMSIIRSLFPEQAAENLDIEIKWTISCADFPAIDGEIIRKGSDLKRMVIDNLYRSGHVIGHEIPSGKIPPGKD